MPYGAIQVKEYRNHLTQIRQLMSLKGQWYDGFPKQSMPAMADLTVEAQFPDLGILSFVGSSRLSDHQSHDQCRRVAQPRI
jgi:hypothetical protein